MSGILHHKLLLVFLLPMLSSVVKTQVPNCSLFDLDAFKLSVWISLFYLGTAYLIMVGENETDLCSMEFLQSMFCCWKLYLAFFS